MAKIDLSWKCVKKITEDSLSLAQKYEDHHNALLTAAQDDLLAFLSVLGEVAGAVANLKFVLSKIPGAPGANPPSVGDIIPIDVIIMPAVVKAGAAVSGGGAVTAGAPPPAGGGALPLVNSALSNSCANACKLGMSGAGISGNISAQLNSLNAAIFAALTNAAAGGAAAKAAAAKVESSVPVPPILVAGSPPPPPINPNSIYSPLKALFQEMMALLQTMSQENEKITLHIDAVSQTILEIRRFIEKFFQIYELFKAFISKDVKKNILSIIKFMIRLEKALKALVLAAAIFPLSIVLAAQMAGWIGIIGQIIALIVGLLSHALHHADEAEDSMNGANDAKHDQWHHFDAIMDCLDGYKSCFNKGNDFNMGPGTLHFE